MSNLTTFAGSNYTVPLIPASHEPAFCTASTSTVLFLWSQSRQLIGYINRASGELSSSGSWNGSWSSTPSSNSSWQIAGTSQAGPHGHFYVAFTPQYDTYSQSTIYYTQSYQSNQNWLQGAMNSRATGIWVNKTKRDNLCIQQANNIGSYIYTTQVSLLGRGALTAPLSATTDMSGGTSAGIANGYNSTSTIGLVGYNETTKMWVSARRNAGASVTVYVYKNIPAPSMTSNLNNYWANFNHSTKIATTFSLESPSDSYDYQSWKIIPLDNGNIAIISKSASSLINYTLLTGNDGVNSTSWTASSIANIGTTTSYNNSAWQDNLPAFVTYDGKYVFVFTQYYYYFSGIVGFFIRVSDGKRLTMNIADTNYAYSPVMLGDNKMTLSYGANSDGGQGQYLYDYDIGYLMDSYATGTDVSSYYTTSTIDNPSASTTYPMIFTVPSPLPLFNKGVI